MIAHNSIESDPNKNNLQLYPLNLKHQAKQLLSLKDLSEQHSKSPQAFLLLCISKINGKQVTAT